MDRLKLLQDGYDEDEFDNDFFDDEEDDEETDNKIYNECMTILHKGDEEFDKVVEENNKEIEQLYEEIANQKFEKIAEIKAEYKYLIKFASDPGKIADLDQQRDTDI